MANRWKGNIIAAAAATSSGTDYTGTANGAWGLNSQLQQKQGGLWAKGQTVPAAPTSVTATVGNAQSVISFAAPADTGGSAITGYTVTSSTGGITATGSASPITITGLTNGTAYTFTVTATNSIGTGASSSPSNSVIPTILEIGQAFGGGYFAGKINISGTIYNLVVAPRATGTSYSAWGPTGVVTGITDPVTGSVNSASLAALGASYAAATFCEGLTIGGYTDWYMPAKNELEVLYYFLKPKTDVNELTSGANPNAVSPEPINTNYTTSNPAQTTATAFKTGGSEAMDIGSIHISSTEGNINYSTAQAFGYQGLQMSTVGYLKSSVSPLVRAIRKVAA